MFESLELLSPDAIIGLIAEYRNDPRDAKVDLGIGVYRDAAGETPVLEVVKQAEQRLVDMQASKAYIGSAGSAEYNARMRELVLDGSVAEDRIAGLQTPGGSGSLRVAAGVILRAKKDAAIWVSEPTWANHVPLLGGAGLQMKSYPYYDGERNALCVDRMLEALRSVPAGDIVLLHACCHNPTGLDPGEDEWRDIADVIVERGLLPFVDIAYQGFATDLDADAFIVRHLADRVPEMIVCSSCSKNFGLYRDRVGSLMFVGRDDATRKIVQSQANNIVRTLYSMPPDHGAAVVSTILGDERLRAEWINELGDMRRRLDDMRALLHDALKERATHHDFSHLDGAKGMFCYLGLTEDQVQRLKNDHGIYMIRSSRINVAGITEGNVGHIASSVAAVL